MIVDRIKEDYEMNRERAKELLPIIQAYAEGKQIQYRLKNEPDSVWTDKTGDFSWNECYEYRIKPEEEAEITSIEELVELSKKECEKPASCRFSKKGIELDKVESLLSELSKRGIYILAKDTDARLFSGTDGKLRMGEMDCTIHFYEVENTKENL